LSLFSVLNEGFMQIIGNSFETADCTLMCDNDVEKGLRSVRVYCSNQFTNAVMIF
jgi:hypothetical protein